MHAFRRRIALGLGLILAAHGAVATEIAPEAMRLEAGLIAALRHDAKTGERAAPSGPAIQAYIHAGYLTAKPTVRADYTDYRLLNKPATLLGLPLVAIEEEYMTQYLGCCVSEGAGATVRITGDIEPLVEFAKRNACRLERDYDARAEFKNYGIAANLPAGRYANLSCRVRDADRAER
ncbi:hypothetical protein K4L06_15675 [Lysobacter sp. BMK333-48F3]|uniref:hypothetical protein n=1 Tax=Lysobacter sp. BMK333-48F3 TaxID=2867962 RepID=UPI001C8C018D|nr:hypothetical protein [Lysobacter sp. BMK333-48F3]MBX9402749.1 hypothetical protein [Lysobacter sp. BMK333-48F3]